MKILCNWPHHSSSRVLTAILTLTLFGGVSASVSEAQPPSYALSVSTSSNRSGAIALQGATLSGNVYVFTSSASNLQNYDPTGIASVCYWLDNTSMTGSANHCESYVPYDFISSVNNSSNSPANPWNTTLVANGTHTITQKVTKSAGGSEVDTATFSVQNAALSVSPTSLSFGSQVEGTTSAAMSVTLTDGSSAPVTFTGATTTGAYAVSQNTCTTLTSNGAKCTISVTFTPTTTGSSTGTLTITDNAHTSPQKVALSGTGTSNLPTITFTANPTTIPDGQSATLSWTTTNATSVSINNGVGAEPTSGSVSVGPTANTTYTLTATGPGGTASQSVTIIVGTNTVQHFEYVMPDQTLYVYDLDNNFQLIKQVSIPQAKGVRGIGAVPGTHMLYISYGTNGDPSAGSVPGSLLAYDLLTDTVVWTTSYSFGIDSFAISNDGKTIYMPSGVDGGTAIWYIIDAASGTVTGNINTGWNGAHDTVVSLDGADVFMGPHLSPYLVEGSTSTNGVVLNIGPLEGTGTSPFTINGKHTLAFTTEMNFFGFEVSYTNEGAEPGKVLYTVPVSGFSVPPGFANNPADHGISLSPDEKEIYLIDTANAYVHVFDVSGLPSAAPTQVANIPLTTRFTGNQSPCLYECEREGWIRHTLDGQYVLVGDSGNVISTSTRQVLATTIPQLYNTRIYVQINWQNGLPISTSTREGLGYVTQ